VTLSAEYLPGCIYKEFRTIQSTAEWQLYPATSQLIMHVQCGSFCNTPQHTAGEVCELETRSGGNRINALQLTWTHWLGYAFPPFCSIRKCLRKVREDKASLALIAPVWRTQPWYPAPLELLIDILLALI